MDFKKYLAEASKQYDFVIKLAGELPEGFDDRLETALKKFEIANLSSGKKTPIQSLPLDFPQNPNSEVTVYETTLNYPTTQDHLRHYIANFCNVSVENLRVRKPGEDYEEMQKESDNKPYEAKLGDPEYKDAPDVNKDELVVTEKGKETFLQSLAKEAKERQSGE
jgi:hypothetical protein